MILNVFSPRRMDEIEKPPLLQSQFSSINPTLNQLIATRSTASSKNSVIKYNLKLKATLNPAHYNVRIL